MPPPVPFQAEPLARLQERFPQALDFVYDCEAMTQGGAIRPGEVAAQLFDFEDGLRLLVSLERHPEGTKLHVSASFETGSKLFEKLMAHKTSKSPAELLQMFVEMVPGRFAELSGDSAPLTFLGVSSFVPHWSRDFEL